ncbi:transcriptional regulator [Paraflavitalea speifideaquila]|uniref:winged helix-turn-helix domain-containing protein n=1 Tax=Paraflavitalea speifideaquila TaxID=3076558 RepID=UPI0028E34ED4|nr:transcriptional regulator [Paraflavitalea speifideiaquila]
MSMLIDGLHKAFERRIRLGIMSILAVNDTLDFNALKDYFEITDGNLASHLKALEQENFIGVKKSFIGKKPNTKYFMTKPGRKAFNDHLKAMEKLIKSQK